jgi:predicted ATPase
MARPMSSPRLIGREAELAGLTGLFARASSGTSVAVVVTGETGVGKTRLVREVTARARDTGAHVWTGRCVLLADGLLPYTPIVELLDGMAADLGHGTLREVAGAAAGRHAVESLFTRHRPSASP